MLVTLGRGLSPVTNKISSLMLEDHFASAVFDLDATIAQSYAGSDDWINLVKAPADGALSSAYNASPRGTISLVGSAGDKDSYIQSAGNGGFRFDNTPYIAKLHRTDMGEQAYSGVVAFRYVPNSAAQGLIASANNNLAAGFSFTVQGTNRLNFRQNNGVSGVSANIATSYVLENGKDYLVGFSKKSAGDQFKFWVQGVGVGMTHASLECIMDAENTTTGVFASTNGTGWPLPADTRIYAASFFNEYLSEAQMAKIMDIYRKRHGRAYS